MTRAIFLRGLGIVYLIAFLSLWVQIDGLVGSDGILPAKLHLMFFKLRQPELGPIGRFLHLPTLCWISSSDTSLHLLCGGGAVLAGLLILGFAPTPVLILLWLFYLSLVNVGQVFLGYQWDALLLETGFLSIFFSPLQLWLRPMPVPTRIHALLGAGRPPALSRPSPVVLFLMRWLLFRLMFLSGMLKLLGGDATWRALTALRYHYQTQPLPTWTSWYANLAPHWFSATSVVLMFLIEVVVPLMFFGPRPLRLMACAATVVLQILIAATGNYGFFNLLAIVLCIPLLDDAVWRWKPPAAAKIIEPHWYTWVAIPLMALLVPLSIIAALQWLGFRERIPDPLNQFYESVSQFDVVNGYGLFASMTTERPELIIEGSDDAIHWHAYEFTWKPGDRSRRPRFCAPHMPRLDWQMWFAALDAYYGRHVDRWLIEFLQRLREGSPPVLKLLRTNPFPRHPPRYIRLSEYLYRFTTPAERRATGDWWHRDAVAQFMLQ